MTFEARYDDLSNDVLANKQKFSQNTSLIDEAVQHLNEHGPPQHAWDQVASGTEEQQLCYQAQGIEERSIQQEDLDVTAQLFQESVHPFSNGSRAKLAEHLSHQRNTVPSLDN